MKVQITVENPGMPNLETVQQIMQEHLLEPEEVGEIDALIQDLLAAGSECTCVLPEQTCRVCRLAARRVSVGKIISPVEEPHESFTA